MTVHAEEQGLSLCEDASGWAPNQRWSIQNRGVEVYRGPEWQARQRYELGVGDRLFRVAL